MGEVLDLREHRRRREALCVCMHCGAEYLWRERKDHSCEPDCMADSRSVHPSNR